MRGSFEILALWPQFFFHSCLANMTLQRASHSPIMFFDVLVSFYTIFVVLYILFYRRVFIKVGVFLLELVCLQ